MKIQFCGKTLLTTYNHLVYKLNYDSLIPFRNNRLTAIRISEEQFDELHLSLALRCMLREQPEFIRGYGFKNETGQFIGHLFVMSTGGNEVLYKIRNIDSYIFAVRTFEQYRGNGYAPEMITWLADELSKDGKRDIYLTVKRENTAAIRVYDKLGFEAIGKKFFVRIFKTNIPYLTL